MMALVMFITPCLANAQIITVYTADGTPHQIDTAKACTLQSSNCVATSNGRCVNTHKVWNCKVSKPKVCSKWATTTKCGTFAGPSGINGLDFTNSFASALAGVAAGAEVRNIFNAKVDSCKRNLLCNQCKGAPDPGLQKVMGAASLASTIASVPFTLISAGVTIAGIGTTTATSIGSALAQAGASMLTGIGAASGAAYTALNMLAAAGPYIAIASLVVTYLVSRKCQPTKLNGYAKWLGKSAQNLGTLCTNKFLGVCLTHTTYFCVYSNKFAYVLAREIKKQLQALYGRPAWPSPPPTAAGCNNIYMSDLAKVDFSKMNLSDLFGNLQANAAKRSYSATAAAKRITAFYNMGTPLPGTTGKAAPPPAAQQQQQASQYNTTVHQQIAANGWGSGTAPAPTVNNGISNMSALCAAKPAQQIAYVKTNLFANKTISQIKSDIINRLKTMKWTDAAGKLHIGAPQCKTNTNPPQTPATAFCYDKQAIMNATIDELAAMFAIALCDIKALP